MRHRSWPQLPILPSRRQWEKQLECRGCSTWQIRKVPGRSYQEFHITNNDVNCGWSKHFDSVLIGMGRYNTISLAFNDGFRTRQALISWSTINIIGFLDCSDMYPSPQHTIKFQKNWFVTSTSRKYRKKRAAAIVQDDHISGGRWSSPAPPEIV